MKKINKIFKWILYIITIKILLIIGFIVVSFILTNIIVNSQDQGPYTKEIYLSDNGIHVDLVIPENEQYIAYGWGSEIFYLNTPTWDDLTFSNAFKAVFTEPTSVMHITNYKSIQKDWVKVKVNNEQLENLIKLINNSFKLDNNGNRIKFKDKGYYNNDEFYKAKGNYSCFMTCNSWTNKVLKKSGIKASYWTWYSAGVINKYK